MSVPTGTPLLAGTGTYEAQQPSETPAPLATGGQGGISGGEALATLEAPVFDGQVDLASLAIEVQNTDRQGFSNAAEDVINHALEYGRSLYKMFSFEDGTIVLVDNRGDEMIRLIKVDGTWITQEEYLRQDVWTGTPNIGFTGIAQGEPLYLNPELESALYNQSLISLSLTDLVRTLSPRTWMNDTSWKYGDRQALPADGVAQFKTFFGNSASWAERLNDIPVPARELIQLHAQQIGLTINQNNGVLEGFNFVGTSDSGRYVQRPGVSINFASGMNFGFERSYSSRTMPENRLQLWNAGLGAISPFWGQTGELYVGVDDTGQLDIILHAPNFNKATEVQFGLAYALESLSGTGPDYGRGMNWRDGDRLVLNWGVFTGPQYTQRADEHNTVVLFSEPIAIGSTTG